MTVLLDFWDSRGFLTYSSYLVNISILLSWSTFIPKKIPTTKNVPPAHIRAPPTILPKLC